MSQQRPAGKCFAIGLVVGVLVCACTFTQAIVKPEATRLPERCAIKSKQSW
jgi:hypothetical protein